MKKTPQYLFSKIGLSHLKKLCHQKILWGFDLDGTLVPLVTHFKEVKLSSETADLVGNLSHRFPVMILSGRSKKDLNKLIHLRSVRKVGNHGMEGVPSLVKGKTEQNLHKSLVREWVRNLKLALQGMPGVLVEDKKISMTVHFRNSPQRIRARRKIMARIKLLKPGPRVVFGKAVFNLLPSRKINKGTALLAVMKEDRCSKSFFIGDDVTDEDVFDLRQKNIFTVRVGRSSKTSAKYYIRSQSEVLRLLKIIDGEICL